METRLFIQGVNLKEDQAWKELYVVIPPGSSATKMPLKILYRDVYYGYGAHRSVFKISKSLLLIFIVLFIMLL